MALTSTQLLRWYASARPLYDRLGRTVVSIVHELLAADKIEFLSVTHRAKEVDSLTEKLKAKNYGDPATEVTDLCGVRVVTYLESGAKQVAQLVRSTFDVDEARSIDKATLLSVDRFGYRSVHLVCTLGTDRMKLPEYSSFANYPFEIQIRTALQHAWAQVEHDRNYKFGGVLPTELQRRLHSAAASLEVVDREFSSIAAEVEQYTAAVQKRAEAGDLSEPVNTASLVSFLNLVIPRISGLLFQPLRDDDSQQRIIQEIHNYGVRTLKDLAKLFSPEFCRDRGRHPDADGTTNEFGILRDAMMYDDIDRYFSIAHDRWAWIDRAAYNLLSERFGPQKVLQVLRANGVEIEGEGY